MTFPAAVTPPPAAVPVHRHAGAPRPGTVLGPHAQRCFACGDRDDGLRLTITVGTGVDVVGRLVFGSPHEGSPGIAHGGLLATAVDETMSGLFTILRTKMVTGSLQVTYRAPVPVGSELFLSARMVGQLGRQYFADGEGRIGGVDGPLALQAHAVFFAVDMTHFAGFAGPEALAGFHPELRD